MAYVFNGSMYSNFASEYTVRSNMGAIPRPQTYKLILYIYLTENVEPGKHREEMRHLR